MDSLDVISNYAHNKNNEGIILDTVVLFLYLIGKFDIKQIKTFAPTHDFDADDYKWLLKIIQPYKKIIITPQIIAELSNQTKTTWKGDKLHLYFCLIVDLIKSGTINEQHVMFNKWTDQNVKKLCKFGFVDMGIFETCKSMRIPVLTNDINFYIYGIEQSAPIIRLWSVKNSHLNKLLK